jgi:predicted GH43/DUF377 family glycosyl hydrolase
MIKVKNYGIFLSTTEKEFESKVVLNPGIHQDGETLHPLDRATHVNGISTIGYGKTKGPTKVVKRLENRLFNSDHAYEKKGVIDARIVKIEEAFYIRYETYDGINTLSKLMTSEDLIHLKKNGIVATQLDYKEYKKCVTNNKNSKLNPKYLSYFNLFSELGVLNDKFRILNGKDVVLFRRKINGKFAILVSIWPGIQIIYFDEFKDLSKEFGHEYFENRFDAIVLDSQSTFEANHLRMGGPSIETQYECLLIYYDLPALAPKNSTATRRLCFKSTSPKLKFRVWTKTWKKKSHENEIAFPIGHAIFDETLYIFE